MARKYRQINARLTDEQYTFVSDESARTGNEQAAIIRELLQIGIEHKRRLFYLPPCPVCRTHDRDSGKPGQDETPHP